jgi:hypothetical protein
MIGRYIACQRQRERNACILLCGKGKLIKPRLGLGGQYKNGSWTNRI